MDNHDVMRVSGEPMPHLGEGNRAGSESDSDSGSGSVSISNPSSSSDVIAHAASDSDSDSSATSEVSDVELDPYAGSRLVRVTESDEQDQMVKKRFLELMSGLGLRTAVETVYKNVYHGLTWQAKRRAFLEISQNMKNTVGEVLGKAKYAWFGGTKHEIDNIFRSGFASRGCGICLSPVHSPLPSLRCCVADENGLYHMVLCRVILGRSELIPPPSAHQQFPSSEEFHSAVDNLASPRVYLIWSSYMNTHVMPQYVVSFRPPVNPLGEVVTFGPPAAPVNPVRAPPVMKPGEFREVGLELAKVLPPIRRRSLVESFKSYRAGKMTKQEMKLKLKELGVDTVLFERLLMTIRRRRGASEEAAPSQAVPLPAQRGSGSRASANKVIKKLRGDRST